MFKVLSVPFFPDTVYMPIPSLIAIPSFGCTGRRTRTRRSRHRTPPVTSARETGDSVAEINVPAVVITTAIIIINIIIIVEIDTAAVEHLVNTATTAALTTTLASVATEWCRSPLLSSFSSWPSGEWRLFQSRSPGVST